MNWIPKDCHLSSVSFTCPYCGNTVTYHHGSTSASRRKSKTLKRCDYEFCPWCGKEVEPYELNESKSSVRIKIACQKKEILESKSAVLCTLLDDLKCPPNRNCQQCIETAVKWEIVE